MSVNGEAAALYMYNGRPNTANACLYTVWLAYGAPHSLGSLAGYTFPTATSAYNYTKKRHTDRNPPRGAAVWFGPTAGPRYSGDIHWQDGDVTVSLGGGNLGATDYPSYGHIGQCTIAQREVQTGRAYAGWSEDFLGNEIDIPGYTNITTAGTGTVTPVEDNTVTLTTDQAHDIGETYNAIFKGGVNMPDNHKSIGQSLSDLHAPMLRIQSPGRGIALVGPGYYRHLNSDEEVTISSYLFSRHLNLNDREFDVIVSEVRDGQGAPASTVAPAPVAADIDYAKISDAVTAAVTSAIVTAVPTAEPVDIAGLIKQGTADALSGSTITVVPKS